MIENLSLDQKVVCDMTNRHKKFQFPFLGAIKKIYNASACIEILDADNLDKEYAKELNNVTVVAFDDIQLQKK